MSKKLFGKVFILLLVVGLLFAATQTVQAQGPTTRTVCAGGGCDYTTIQAAITAATAGDTITVAAGSYNENVIVDKSVTLTGAGRDVTTVTAVNTIEPVFRVIADGVTISGFTLTGASGHQDEPFQDGDGINLDGADNCVVTDNAFIENRQGAYVTGSYNAFQRNIISNNFSNGVILIDDEDEPTHLGDNNTFDGNTIADNIKYGLSISSSNNTVINNTITGNDGCGVALFGGTSGNTINFNAISGNTGIGGVYSIASYTNDATKNWWGTETGPIHSTNPGATGNKVYNVDYSPWLGFVPGTSPMDWYLNTTGTIQDGIDAAANGETIHVLAGTYVEDVTVTNKFFNLIGEVDGTGAPVSILQGTLSIDNPSYGPPSPPEFTLIKNIYFEGTDNHLLILKNLNGGLVENCVFDGNGRFLALPNINGINLVSGPNGNSDITVTGSLFKDGLYVGIGGYADGLTVQTSEFTNVKSGINLQGGGNLVVTDSTFLTKPVSDGDSYGIRFASSSGSTPNLKVTGSTFNIDDSLGFDPASGDYHAALYIRAGATGSLELDKNQILGDVVQLSTTSLDASPNWWGSAAGPAAGTFVGTAEYAPWCGDAACETFAPDVDGNVYLSGTINVPGGILIGTPGLTYHLAADAVIQNDSPCFVIEASNTRILAEPGAKCIPTGESNGIDVAADLNNITIDGLEIDGSIQTSGTADGIHFAGVVTDFVLADNKIHNMRGDGIEFAAQPAGVVDIAGNLFQNNGGNGIEAGAYTVPAEYNSWGNVAGAAAGDGASSGVDADPFTHVDLYLESSGTPWANQVVSGQTITYTVMGHLVNANAADFALTYPENLTFVSSTASNSFGVESVTHTAGTRTLRFVGYSITGNKTGTLPIFSVTFTAGTPVVNAPMLLDELTDGFGMVGVQSSSNIYAAALLDSTVTIVTLPTISSTDIQGYYLSGEQRQFSVVLDNPSTGADYAHVYVDFTMTNAQVDQISLIEYSVDNGASWVALGTGPGTSFANVGTDIVGYFGKVTGGGFALAPNTSLTTLFRVTFVTRDAAVDLPTSYAVSMQLRDADALPASNLLDEFTDTMYVYDKPTVTYTSDPYFIIGEAGNFAVTIINPVTGKNYANTAVFDVVLLNHAVADITAISCTDGTTTWNLIGKLTPDGANVKARIGGLTDGFLTIPAPLNVTLPCTVTYATAGTYTTSTSMVDVVSLLPERVVSANIPGTATVYAKPVITATNLGGPFDAGLPETVSLSIDNTSIPEPFEVVFSYPAGTVIVYNGVTYTCAATCPVIPVELTAEPTVLDFTVTFDEAWTGDVSVSLFDSDWTPADRLLASASATGAVVNGNFNVTGTFSMQGRATRAGIPVTLTWSGTFATYGPTANTIEAISNNFSQTVTYGGYYTITTNQPRYLNVYADVSFSKIINVHADYPLPALQLRAGNAVWTDGNNVVNLDDANLVGTQWGGSGSTNLTIDHGDVNFDGKVNIQDLALVGGNYELTSAGAYGTTWVP